MLTKISDLPPNLKQDALTAFERLANEQRGDPEYAGGGGPLKSNPGKMHAIGVWLALSEHVGDLTHRMAQKFCQNINYGEELVYEKCNRAARWLSNNVAQEIEQNVKNNYDYHVETEDLEMSFEEWHSEWVAAAKFYADQHRKLVVYNKAQFVAREAAIAVGMLDYKKAKNAIEWLLKHINNGTWVDVAGIVFFDDTGRLLTYQEWPSSLK